MRSRALLLAVLLAAGARPVSAQILAQIEPAQVTLVARPDVSTRGTLMIRNLGREAARVRVRLADLRIGPDGAAQLGPAGATATSLDGRIRIEPGEFALPAGESAQVRLSVAMPDTGPATRYGVVIAEMVPAAQAWPDTPVPLGPGATLFVSRANAAAAAGEIAGLSVRHETGNTFQVSVRVWNGGERPLDAGGEIVVRDSLGSDRARGRLTRGMVLPRSLRALTWTCPVPLPPGRYDVIAHLRSGGLEATATTEIRWPMSRPLVLQQASSP